MKVEAKVRGKGEGEGEVRPIGPHLERDVAEDSVALSDGKVAILQGGDVLEGVELGKGLGLVSSLHQVAPARWLGSGLG